MVIPARFDGGPLKITWRAHVLIRTNVHQHVHNVQVFGLAGWFSVLDRCQDVSSFKILLFIFIRGDGAVPRFVLLWYISSNQQSLAM